MKIRMIAFIILTAMMVAGVAGAQLSRSVPPVAHWTFDEFGDPYGWPYTITEIPEEIENHYSSINGNPPAVSEMGGVLDGSFYFPGTDGMIVSASSQNLNIGTQSFSLSAWVNFDDSSAAQVLAKRGGSFLFDLTDSGYLRVQLGTGGAYSLPPAVYTADVDGLFMDQQWHFVSVAINRTSGEGQFWVDGDMITTSSIVTDPNYSFYLNDIWVAPNASSLSSAGLDPFIGRMDDLKIFVGAIDDTQVNDMLEEVLGGCCPGACQLNATAFECHDQGLPWFPNADSCVYNGYCTFGYSIPGNPGGFTPA